MTFYIQLCENDTYLRAWVMTWLTSTVRSVWDRTALLVIVRASFAKLVSDEAVGE